MARRSSVHRRERERRNGMVVAAIFGALVLVAPSSVAGWTPDFVRDINRGDSAGSFGCEGSDCVGAGVIWNVHLPTADPTFRVVVTMTFEYRTTRGDDAKVRVNYGRQHRSA